MDAVTTVMSTYLSLVAFASVALVAAPFAFTKGPGLTDRTIDSGYRHVYFARHSPSPPDR